MLACFCEAFWRRVKVQFELFYAGWLPASPPTFENKCKFLTYLGSVSPWIFSFYENGPSKKNFPLRGPGFGPRTGARERARGARAAREARYISLYLVWPCLNCFPEDSTFLRVFAHSTRASGVVIFNKNFATFQVSKTNEKIVVFALSTRPSEGVLFFQNICNSSIFFKNICNSSIFFTNICNSSSLKNDQLVSECQPRPLEWRCTWAQKCEKMRKKVQLYKCKSVHHIKLFLWLHPCASIMRHARKTQQGPAACATQHPWHWCSFRLSQRCIWRRDCAIMLFEIEQNFVSKRKNACRRRNLFELYFWYQIKRRGYAYSFWPRQDPHLRLLWPPTLIASGSARTLPYAQFGPYA